MGCRLSVISRETVHSSINELELWQDAPRSRPFPATITASESAIDLFSSFPPALSKMSLRFTRLNLPKGRRDTHRSGGNLADAVRSARRLRIIPPSKPKPARNVSQVAGSGTGTEVVLNELLVGEPHCDTILLPAAEHEMPKLVVNRFAPAIGADSDPRLVSIRSCLARKAVGFVSIRRTSS